MKRTGDATPARQAVDPLRRRLLALALASAAAPAAASVEYPDVRGGSPLAFPDDEGAHPAFRNEWWYVTGWLRDRQARELGFQVTFFRNRPGVAEASRSAFAPKQLLFAHAALADAQWQRLRYDERAAREGFGLAAAALRRTDVRIDDWSLVQDGHAYAARIRARAFAMDLVLEASAPPMLQGERGVSRKGPDPDDASFYYSRPQLAVRGSVTIDERARDVSGVAWLDHEWSSRYLPRGAVGWDWTGINLDDGGALMAFRIRDARGGVVWAGGGYRDRQGAERALSPSDVEFEALRRWRSPRTGFEYPVSFRVRAGDVVVALEPLFPDQELDARAGVGTVYWEGAVRAAHSGQAAGRGYLELTGYGAPLRI
ncbi:MAG TPA: lipocalin-like domain-containing protein [Casimicrobiaceae bacterium]